MRLQVININYLKKLNLILILSSIFWVILGVMSLSTSLSVHAQQFDNAYLKWKAEQQAQDAKLKKVDDNYYLSKPNLSKSNLSQSSSRTSSATNSQRSNKTVSSTQKKQLSSGAMVSLNSASLEQLQQLSGVGAKKAQAIIDFRNQNGKFNSIDDLQKVKGIGPKLLAKNKAQLSL